MEFYFERLYGDLTRVGNFPERYFGWQAPQPLIPSELYKDYSFAEADIIVIGDSFSFTRNWQTRLIADGLKVSTLYYTDESLPGNLGEALRTAGFKGRYVIIQKVERKFETFMKSLVTQQHPFVKNDISVDSSFPLYPITRRERISLNKLNGGDWGFKALYNTIKLFLKIPDKHLKSGWVQPINFDGCQFFSHRLCHYALFIESDFQKETFSSIANVLTLNKNLQRVGIQAIWMIVPDKATVYLGYGALNQHPYQNIWQLFARYPELIAPDLGAAFIQKSHTIKDLYMPNDTHLSTTGFIYLGDLMTQVIRNIKAK